MKILAISYLFLILPSLVLSQVDDNCKRSTEGTEFWFAFMESRTYHNRHFVEITVTARERTKFVLYYGKYTQTYIVEANSNVRVKPYHWYDVEAEGSENIQQRAIHLVAENPVNVYALNWDRNSADVAVIYPIESLGYEYFAMCYAPHIHTNGMNYGNGRNSEFLIVATKDETTVEITPSVVTDGGKPADSVFTVLLDQGDIYQVQSMNDYDALEGEGDLTGSHVKADKPIAFYSGSLATTVPADDGVTAWDHLFEQIPPLYSWGKEFYAVPLKTREQDRYRIMAAQNNTSVFITGREPIYLNRGDFAELTLQHDDPKRIYADKPVMVAQFAQSRSVDQDFTGGDGDPFMIILSPTSQSKNDVTFVAYDSDQIVNYSVNIVTLTEETGNMFLDGNNIQSEFKPFPEGDYSYTQISITPGTHRINNSNPDRGFLAYVYGFGGVESYGYGVGFNLDIILDISESIGFSGDSVQLCYGDSELLDAGPYFDDYQWNTGDSSQTLLVSEEGKYALTATTADGCILTDSIYIFVSHPITNIGVDTAFCSPNTLQLDAGPGFESYIWQTGDTTQTIIAGETGDYHVVAYDEFGCSAKDTMHLEVYPLPDITLDGETHLCGERQSSISATITNAPDYVWDYDGGVAWSSNKPDSLNILQVDRENVNLSSDYWGEYEISMDITTINQCNTHAVHKVGYFEIPTSDFEPVENPDSTCHKYNREIQYIGNATEGANFYWDFGGLHLFDTLGFQYYVVSVPPFSTALDISLHVEQNGCISPDTSYLTIGANPDFELLTGKSRGCDSTTIYFEGRLGHEDDLLFEWDFGDGSPISNARQPIHFYDQTGFYDVGLTITQNLSGCQIGFTIDSMIKVFPTPTAEFSIDPTTCYPDTTEVIYLNAIDSSICYWSFEDCHQVGGNNHTIDVAIDEPTASITLVVDEYGCFSDTATKALKRNPHFDFYTDNLEGCQPYTLEIFADPFDEFLEFTWITDFMPYPEGNSLLTTLQDSGAFGFELVGTSTETGCSATVIKDGWVFVHPKPISNFTVDYEVATIEHPTIQFADSSIFGFNYYWDFDDGNTSEEKNPTNEYLEIGEYYPQLITESDFGCLDTSTMLIQILPFDVFTPNAFRPDSDIPENRVFMPVGVGADPNRFLLQIFDRWGQIVFESKSFDHKWDGKMQNGDNAPMGNYVWITHFFDIQGYEHYQKGQVLLVR